MMDLLQAVQAGGNVALMVMAAHLIKLDRRVLRLEIKTNNEQPQARSE